MITLVNGRFLKRTDLKRAPAPAYTLNTLCRVSRHARAWIYHRDSVLFERKIDIHWFRYGAPEIVFHNKVIQ